MGNGMEFCRGGDGVGGGGGRTEWKAFGEGVLCMCCGGAREGWWWGCVEVTLWLFPIFFLISPLSLLCAYV